MDVALLLSISVLLMGVVWMLERGAWLGQRDLREHGSDSDQPYSSFAPYGADSGLSSGYSDSGVSSGCGDGGSGGSDGGGSCN
jgi:hypothetical protein